MCQLMLSEAVTHPSTDRQRFCLTLRPPKPHTNGTFTAVGNSTVTSRKHAAPSVDETSTTAVGPQVYCISSIIGQRIVTTMAGVLKKTTGLTGLVVATKPHYTLGVLYTKILRALDKLPKDYAYRNSTESLIKERADILKNNQNIAEVEKKIGCGQVEELIVQAENELLLARNMATWKPWEPVQEAPPNQWAWPPAK